MSDLISREALLDTIRQKMFDTRYDIELAMDVIKTAPAVDAVPVVHGEWIKCGEDDSDEGDYYCSACNHKKFFPFEEPNYNYCPYCNAKMDKERDGEDG